MNMKSIETFIVVFFALLLHNSLLEISCMEWAADEFPDPQIDFTACGLDEQGFVCDPDEILDVGDRRSLDNLIKEFHKAANGTCIDRCGNCDSYPGMFIGVAIADRIYYKEFEKTELIQEVTTTVTTTSEYSGLGDDGLNFDIDDYLKRKNKFENIYDHNEAFYEDDSSYDKDFFADYGVNVRETRRKSRAARAYEDCKSGRNIDKNLNTDRKKQVYLLHKRHKSQESYETKPISVLHPNNEDGNKFKKMDKGDYSHINNNDRVINNDVTHSDYLKNIDRFRRSYDIANEVSSSKSEHNRHHRIANANDHQNDRKSHKSHHLVANDDTKNDKSRHMSQNVIDGDNHNRNHHRIHRVSSNDKNEKARYINSNDGYDDYNNYNAPSKAYDIVPLHPANQGLRLGAEMSIEQENLADYDENLLTTQNPKIRVTNDPVADWAEYLALKRWNWQHRLSSKEKNCQNTVVILLYAHKKQVSMVGGNEVRYHANFPAIVQQTKHFFINYSKLQNKKSYKGLRAIIDSYWSQLKESNFKGGDDYKSKMTTVIIILVVLGVAVVGFIVFICVDANKTERKFSKVMKWKSSF